MVLKIGILFSFLLLPDHSFHSFTEILHIFFRQADKLCPLAGVHPEKGVVLQFYDRAYFLLD